MAGFLSRVSFSSEINVTKVFVFFVRFDSHNILDILFGTLGRSGGHPGGNQTKIICQRLLAGLVLNRLCPCDGLRLNGPVDRPPCEPWACGLLAQQLGDQGISPTSPSHTEIQLPSSLAQRPWRWGPVGRRAAGPRGWAGGAARWDGGRQGLVGRRGRAAGPVGGRAEDRAR